MSLLSDFGEILKKRRVEKLTKKIAKLGLKRRGYKAKAIKLVHKREKLLGQELTETPRGLS